MYVWWVGHKWRSKDNVEESISPSIFPWILRIDVKLPDVQASVFLVSHLINPASTSCPIIILGAG